MVCALAPIIFKFNLIDSHISFEMTIMTLLFMAILLLSAKRLNQIITESLEVRLQRELAEQTIIRQAQFDELTELPNRRLFLATLRQATNNNEFELYFQGQYDSDNRRVGAETLLRWNHPDKGVIAPGLFIDIAEQSGLIVPIGDWVLRSACEHLISLDSQLKLSVNVSPRQFSNLDFVDQLQQVLADTGANPDRLKFEITESLAMANIEHTIDTMNQLKQIGIGFSVDDFGTGYSSLNYLHRLPVDELKIDQSFVRNISSASDHAVIVDTIIVMAQKLNLKIVAEGIESVDELDYLKARQCDRYQGYYFARPVPFDQFTT
ncbi:MAG: GGDEF domain-containing protein [Gammaproteobacteria bacterium]|nr:GGDEF domain-containing protein [Gammaproteobacteria bacterium]